MAKTTLKVDGMTCEHCVGAVSKALQALDGVEKAKVNLKKGLAKVTYQDGTLRPEDLAKAVQAAGYEAHVA